jgi:ElaB/YqjD/DUF883 family membrane-anchored ribosome-binding protein
MAVTIPIISEFDGKGIKSAVAEFKQLEGAGAKAQFALKKAAVPAAAALAALGAAATVATKAAVEDLKAQQLLAQALRNSTGATDAQIAANEKFIAATERAAAVSDEQLRPALGNLVRATGDVKQAQDLLTVALDISAATGKDLESVSLALSKAANGQVTALTRLGIPLDENAVKTKDFNAILGQLSDTFGGAAAASANSYEGQMRRISIALDNTKENIGMALIPVLERLLPVLDKAAQFVQDNTDVLVKMGIAVGAVAGAIVAINAAMKIYQAVMVVAKVATIAFNAVLAANPIGLAVVAVAALVAGFVVLVNKTGSIRNAFAAMGNFIIGIFENIGNTYVSLINKIIDGLNVINPFGDIGKLSNFQLPRFAMTSGATGGFAQGPPSDLTSQFNAPIVPLIPDVSTPSGGGGGGGGGAASKATRAAQQLPLGPGMIGGGAAILPIDDWRLMLPEEDRPIINVTVNTVTAPSDLGDTIVDALKDYTRRSGPLDLAIAI